MSYGHKDIFTFLPSSAKHPCGYWVVITLCSEHALTLTILHCPEYDRLIFY